MKQELIYRCEICNTVYNNKEICEKCEESHRVPIGIKSRRYQPITNNATGYPDKITVVFDDDAEIIYKRG